MRILRKSNNRVFVDGKEVFDVTVTIIHGDPVTVTITPNPSNGAETNDAPPPSGGGPGEERNN